MKESLKKNKLAQYMIRKGWSFSAIRGRKEQRKKIRQQERTYHLNVRDCIFTGVDGVRFYLPEYKKDVVQKDIVINADYYEADGLEKAKEYVEKKGSLINALDIGANIGSHTMYFIKKWGVKKVWSFEPVPSTFAILRKNIEINDLGEKVVLENVGVGEKEYHASVKEEIKYNRGGTSIQEDSTGPFEVKTIDSYRLSDISLIKIDTEGYELKVLQGAEATIVKNRPIILAEIADDNIESVRNMMRKWNYKEARHSGENYIFLPGEL